MIADVDVEYKMALVMLKVDFAKRTGLRALRRLDGLIQRDFGLGQEVLSVVERARSNRGFVIANAYY